MTGRSAVMLASLALLATASAQAQEVPDPCAAPDPSLVTDQGACEAGTPAVAAVSPARAPTAITPTVAQYPVPASRSVYAPAARGRPDYLPLEDRGVITGNRVAPAPRVEDVPQSAHWPPDVRYSDAQMVYNAARYAYGGGAYSFVYGGLRRDSLGR